MDPLYLFPFATDRADGDRPAAARVVALAVADLLASARLAEARYIHLPGPDGRPLPLAVPFDLDRVLGASPGSLDRGHILCGEIRHDEAVARASFRLVALPGRNLVADGEEEGDPANLAALPGRIAKAVIAALKLKADPRELAEFDRPLCESSKAWAAFCRGADLATHAGNDTAVRLKAASALREALAIEPDFKRAFELLYALGLYLAKCGRHAEAIEEFNVLLRHRPDESRLLKSIAEAWIRCDEPARAVAPARRAFELDPADDNLLLKLAWLGEVTGDLVLARASYEEAHRRELEPEKVLEKMVAVTFAAGATGECEASAREGLERYPANGQFPFHLALCRRAAGDPPATVATIVEAGMAADPTLWALPYLLAQLAEEAGDPVRATELRDKARELNPTLERDSEALELFKEGSELIRDGAVEQGLERLEKVLVRDPRFWEANLFTGVGLRHLERKAEAAERFRRVLAAVPDQPEAHNELAIHHLELAEYEAAESHAAQAVKAKPDHAGFLCNHGLACLYLGDVERAERNFLAAKWNEPDNVVAENCLLLLGELKRETETPGFMDRLKKALGI